MAPSSWPSGSATLYDNAVSAWSLPALSTECSSITLRDAAGGAENVRVTRWAPLIAGGQPEAGTVPAAVGGAISELMRVVTAAGTIRERDVEGVEWWSQYRPPTQDLKMHVDNGNTDRLTNTKGRHSRSRDALAVPLLSAIHYLDDVRAPTLVLDQRFDWAFAGAGAAGGSGSWRKEPWLPGRAALAYPRRGRVLVINGTLLHMIIGEGQLDARRPPATARRSPSRADCAALREEGCARCVEAGCGWCRRSGQCVLDEPNNGCDDSYDAVGMRGQTTNCSSAAPQQRLTLVLNLWRARPDGLVVMADDEAATHTQAGRDARAKAAGAAAQPGAGAEGADGRTSGAQPLAEAAEQDDASESCSAAGSGGSQEAGRWRPVAPTVPQADTLRRLRIRDVGSWFTEHMEALDLHLPRDEGAADFFTLDPNAAGALVLGDPGYSSLWFSGRALFDFARPQLLLFGGGASVAAGAANAARTDPSSKLLRAARRYGDVARLVVVNPAADAAWYESTMRAFLPDFVASPAVILAPYDGHSPRVVARLPPGAKLTNKSLAQLWRDAAPGELDL